MPSFREMKPAFLFICKTPAEIAWPVLNTAYTMGVWTKATRMNQELNTPKTNEQREPKEGLSAGMGMVLPCAKWCEKKVTNFWLFS